MPQSVLLHFLAMASFISLLGAACLALVDIFKCGVRFLATEDRLMRLVWFWLTALLLVQGIEEGGLPGLTSGADYYLWISWTLMVAYLIFSGRIRYPIVVAILAPLVLLFLVSSSLLAHRTVESASETGIAFRVLHLVPAALAEVSLVLALVVSVIYLVQERRLKRKDASPLKGAAPSLDALEGLNRRFVVFGFFAMTFSILSGSLWALYYGRGLLSHDAYQWLGFLAWFLLGLIHYLRAMKLRSGRELSRFTVIATGVLLVMFLTFVLFGGQVAHGGLYG